MVLDKVSPTLASSPPPTEALPYHLQVGRPRGAVVLAVDRTITFKVFTPTDASTTCLEIREFCPEQDIWYQLNPGIPGF